MSKPDKNLGTILLSIVDILEKADIPNSEGMAILIKILEDMRDSADLDFIQYWTHVIKVAGRDKGISVHARTTVVNMSETTQ